MTLRSLKIFVAVATYKNMTKTAEKLFISQPSISQAISEIEEEYNVVLFDRLKNGLVLTTVGNDMLKYAKAILSQYDELESVLKSDSLNPRIRLGASSTAGATIIKQIIRELMDLNKKLDYTTFVGNTSSVEEKILSNEIDIGIVEGDISFSDIKSEFLANDKLVLICSPEHRFYGKTSISIFDLANEPLILREESSGTRKQLTDNFKALHITPNIVWSCTNNEVVISAVKENLGVSVLSAKLCYESLSNGTLWSCNIRDVNLARTFKLVYHKDKYFSKTMKDFVTLVKKYSPR